MRFDITALTLAAGLIWGATILAVASADQLWPDYGRAFLDLIASIYPGYHPGSSAGSVIVGSLYGFVDGAIAGAIFGWLYNFVHDRRGEAR